MTISNTSASSGSSGPGDQRVFSTANHASLWFSLGVGLLVIQIGAYLVPGMGTRDAVFAIMAGSVLGAAVLAWVAHTACRTGLSSAGLIQRVYGPSFGRLPIFLNVVQLIGWTSFELVVMRDSTAAIVEKMLGISVSPWVTTSLWGGLLALLMLAPMLTLVRQFVSRIGLPLVIASLAWLTWQFGRQLGEAGFSAFWNRTGDGTMGLLSGMDLVMAMPISWLPLIADYARHGKQASGAFWGTWGGYAIANMWCYGLGVLIANTTAPGTDLVAALLLAQGGLIALGLIMIDELDNAYGDLYSASMSTRALQPPQARRQWSLKRIAIALAAVSTLIAIVLPMHQLEPFMLMLSAIFIPLYGTVLGTLWRTREAPSGQTQWPAFAIWVTGIVVFNLIARLAPEWGATIPTLLLTIALARLRA
jgi:NCS1 family nucleobase:cation symporter-1